MVKINMQVNFYDSDVTPHPKFNLQVNISVFSKGQIDPKPNQYPRTQLSNLNFILRLDQRRSPSTYSQRPSSRTKRLRSWIRAPRPASR